MACVQSGDSVGACMWMLDGWELYVYGNLLVKCEIDDHRDTLSR